MKRRKPEPEQLQVVLRLLLPIISNIFRICYSTEMLNDANANE
jgi:hypothetical protein